MHDIGGAGGAPEAIVGGRDIEQQNVAALGLIGEGGQHRRRHVGDEETNAKFAIKPVHLPGQGDCGAGMYALEGERQISRPADDPAFANGQIRARHRAMPRAHIDARIGARRFIADIAVQFEIADCEGGLLRRHRHAGHTHDGDCGNEQSIDHR